MFVHVTDDDKSQPFEVFINLGKLVALPWGRRGDGSLDFAGAALGSGHFGCTVAEFVRRLRIDWAAEQLRSQSCTLSQLSLDAGFGDQAHFSSTWASPAP